MTDEPLTQQTLEMLEALEMLKSRFMARLQKVMDYRRNKRKNTMSDHRMPTEREMRVALIGLDKMAEVEGEDIGLQRAVFMDALIGAQRVAVAYYREDHQYKFVRLSDDDGTQKAGENN